MDSVEISLRRSSLAPFIPNSRLLAWITPKDSEVSLDQAGPVLWNAAPPNPLRVLFAFNHVFPAYTPSQGLRRWDGAHTGPEGGRHGLYNLLRPARNAQLPMLLLDLASPASISALDYQGGLDLVRSLTQVGLVTLASPLPESGFPGSAGLLPGPVSQHFLDENSAALTDFNLPASGLIYQPLLGGIPENVAEPVELVHSARNVNVQGFPVRWYAGRTLIQLPAWPGTEDPQQVSASGLTLPWKELLVRAALQHNHEENLGRDRSYLVLGGSLPQSAWGQPASARAGLDYVYAHPWISIVSPTDVRSGILLNVVRWSPAINFAAAKLAPDDLLENLLAAPQNSASHSAWQAYRALFAPIFPPSPQLPLLRQEYLGEVSTLLKAARWVDDRQPMGDCDTDLDGDGQPECILANDRSLALFELEGGTLTHLFLACPDTSLAKAYQVVGPSSQLITGLSEPMEWNLDEGENLPADPGVFTGALSGPPGEFLAEITLDQLVLKSADGLISKSYQLAPKGLHVEIRSQFPAQLPNPMVVPVLIEPAESLKRGRLEQYQSSQTPPEIAWQVNEQTQLVLHTVNDFTVISFLDSWDLLARTEDPNYTYPPGHYLPFPLVILQISSNGNIFLDFQLSCE